MLGLGTLSRDASGVRAPLSTPEDLSVQRRGRWGSLLAALAIVVLVPLWGDPTFFENDNFGLRFMIRAGERVGYVGTLWTSLLGFLYRRVDGAVPWYALGLYAAYFVALFLFLESLRTTLGWGALARLLSVPYCVLCTFLLVQLSYNGASILLGANALLFFLTTLERPRISSAALIAIGLCVAACYEIRKEGLVAVVVFLSPALLAALLRHGRARWRRMVVVAGVALLVMGADVVADRATRTEEDMAFDEFNALRGRIHGFPAIRFNAFNADIQEANGWSQLDYGMFRNFFFMHEEKFGTEAMRRFAEHALPLGTYWREALASGVEEFAVYVPQLLVLAGFVFLALLTRGRGTFVQVLLYALFCTGGMLAMSAFLRFPVRIGHPLFLSVMAVVMYWTCLRAGTGARIHGPGVLTAALVLAGGTTVWGGVELARRVSTGRESHAELRADLAALAELGPESIVVCQPRTMKWQRADPLDETPLPFREIRIGWHAFTPLFYRSLDLLGIRRGSELLPAMIDRADAYLVLKTGWQDYLLGHLRQTYELECSLRAVAPLGGDIAIYQLESARAPAWDDGGD